MVIIVTVFTLTFPASGQYICSENKSKKVVAQVT